MKKNCLIVSLSILLISVSCLAADSDANKPYLSAQRMLAINRSLLIKNEAEYRSLLKQEPSEPSEEFTKRLSDLRYKIEALQEDGAKLRLDLPKSLRANEFLKDILVRRSMTGTPLGAVNVTEEKEINQRLNQIYEMHEKALAYVAEDRLEEACRLYEEIILLSPDDDEAYLLLGHSRLLLEDYEKAKIAFLNAVNIEPKNTKEITRLYENVLVENPQDDVTYAHLGFANWILGRESEARECFRQALLINPDNRVAANALAGAPENSQ